VPSKSRLETIERILNAEKALVEDILPNAR
jgi:hypothetical protein